jgi:exodeoxyribonuclease-3
VKIATWNVNSVKARLDHLLSWLRTASPDVLLLQEIKCQEEGFPFLEVQSAGYHAAVHGQKSYNGVAILSKNPPADVVRGLPGEPADEQARWIEATVGRWRVASIYLPNGNPAPGDKFDYKLAWMRRLIARTKAMLSAEMPFVLAGDFNVCPTDDDVYDPLAWRADALCRPESRSAWRELVHLGLTDAFRTLHPEPNRYTFWDYQAGAWQRDNGLRIDHILLSPQAADHLAACDIDKDPRSLDKASDHTPVWVRLE